MTSSVELTGFTVGVTADRRWVEQAALFERRGAAVDHGPAITTLPMGPESPLRQATADIIARPPAVLIANTGLGIRSWFANADSWGMGHALEAALSQAQIYARGPKAAGAVHAFGLEVKARGRSERLTEIVDLILESLQPGQRVVMQMDGSQASPEIDRLRACGADVLALPVYRWTLPEDRVPALRLANSVIAGRVQAVTFTAGPAVRNWLAIAADAGVDEDLRLALTDGRCIVGCVGPVCAETAAAHGLASPYLVQPDTFRLGPLVRAVARRLADRQISIQIGSTTMMLSGTAVLIAGDSLCLPPSEARLLATLARRPNAVLAKEQLFQAVWPRSTADSHTVEVAVARLRKRLRPYGVSVHSVRRRGYTLRA
ncbi:MAG TPA: uroporphyrinogen-III synthase [Acidimicrobiales bacterium]|nr:uroporphyrinogen-III synthase [Acidimicrobiales bacterium]